MRRRTIVRIGIVVAVVLGGGWLLVLATGSASERRDATGGLVVVLLIGALLAAGWRFKVLPRREYQRAQANELRLTNAPGDPLRFLDRGFLLLRRPASVRDVENTSWGTWHGRDVAVFDFWLARSSDASVGDHEYYTCALTPVPETWPRLSISRERIETQLADAVGLRDVDFELESFNRLFEVRAGDRRFADAVIDSRMIDWLLTTPERTGFEILDGSLLCHIDRGSGSDVMASLETLESFLERIPAVVPSMYPGTGV